MDTFLRVIAVVENGLGSIFFICGVAPEFVSRSKVVNVAVLGAPEDNGRFVIMVFIPRLGGKNLYVYCG